MQVFSNNALTTLAAELSAGATSMTVTSSTGFASITSPQFELITLEAAPATREIVKVTGRSGNTWTIARAQEGTTAVLWPSGSKVEARATAGTLSGMQQKDVGSIALGSNATANATDGTAVGINASAGGAYSTAIGSNASSSGQGGFAVGYAAVASGSDSVSLGANSDATASESTAIGSLSQAAGTSSAAVGKSANASGVLSSSFGPNTTAPGDYSAAVGFSADALGLRSVAIGPGSQAHGARSTCFGPVGTFADYAICSTGFWSVPGDDWNDANESWTSGPQAVFATPHFDLAVPPAWQAETVYAHGQIVKPTTGGNPQYRCWANYDTGTLLHLTPESGASEPTWPGAGDSVVDGDVEWIGNDLVAGYDTESVPGWLDFWPSEIAFICQEYSAATGTPTVSIGTASAPTLILNAASVGITAAGQVFRFTLPNPCPRIPAGESIRITLAEAASAGVVAGRFLFAGAFVAVRNRT